MVRLYFQQVNDHFYEWRERKSVVLPVAAAAAAGVAVVVAAAAAGVAPTQTFKIAWTEARYSKMFDSPLPATAFSGPGRTHTFDDCNVKNQTAV